MTNVLSFPDSRQRVWADMERGIRVVLEEFPEVVDGVLVRMRHVFDASFAEIRIDDVPEVCLPYMSELSRLHKQTHNALLNEALRLSIELEAMSKGAAPARAVSRLSVVSLTRDVPPQSDETGGDTCC